MPGPGIKPRMMACQTDGLTTTLQGLSIVWTNDGMLTLTITIIMIIIINIIIIYWQVTKDGLTANIRGLVNDI